MLQHVLSDTVIPECGVFPLKRPHAHNFLYSVFSTECDTVMSLNKQRDKYITKGEMGELT